MKEIEIINYNNIVGIRNLIDKIRKISVQYTHPIEEQFQMLFWESSIVLLVSLTKLLLP